MSIEREAKFYGYVARMTEGFYLGVMETQEKIPRHALLFFDGAWVLYGGFRFRNPQFQGAISQRWVLRASAPPFTWGALLDAEGMTPPYSTIIQVLWESPGRWQGLDRHGQLIVQLTDQGASDVFRCRQHWEGHRMVVET